MNKDLPLATRILLSMQKAGHAMMQPERFAELFSEGFASELSYTQRGQIIQLYSVTYARLKACKVERELERSIKGDPMYSDVIQDVNELIGYYL